MSTNIFQIWDKIGRKTPFAVRRDNWSEGYYTVVTEVECDKMPYGKAYGYPTNNGIYSNHYEYDKDWRNYKLIPCGGCYQWHLIENADLESYKRGLEATKKTVISGQTINSKVYFGKYKGQTIDEISKENPLQFKYKLLFLHQSKQEKNQQPCET